MYKLLGHLTDKTHSQSVSQSVCSSFCIYYYTRSVVTVVVVVVVALSRPHRSMTHILTYAWKYV